MRRATLALALLLATQAGLAEESGLRRSIERLDAGLASGLDRTGFLRFSGAVRDQTRLIAAGGGTPPAEVRELMAAVAVAEAVWHEDFGRDLCNDPEDMAEALRELKARSEAALARLTGEP